MSWRRFFRRARWDDERRRELESYIEIEIDDAVARGESPDAARARAYRKLGNPTLVREEIFRMNTIGWIESLWQDVRYGARLLRLNPGFAAVALLSLSLGIGANAAIFQLLDAVRLRTLPVPSPEQLVEIRVAPNKTGRSGQFTGRRPNLTRPLWNEIRQRAEGVTDLFAWGSGRFDLATSGESRYADGLWVSEKFFEALGVTPAIGRLATMRDDQAVCASPPVVISHGFWQREFGGSPDVLGRTVRLDGHVLDIAGVTPASFFGVEVGRGFDVIVPICARDVLQPFAASLDPRITWWLASLGRLQPGWTAERVTASLQAASPAWFEATVSPSYNVADSNAYRAFRLMAEETPTGVSSLRRQYSTPLVLLLTIAGLVLFIACVNLANLMLARATARGREIAVRLAIGASRGRVVRQLMAESLLVAAIGAALGIWVAQSLSRLLVAFLSSDGSAWVLDLAVNWRVIGFSAALAMLTCVLFGLAPAVRATRTPPRAVLTAGARGVSAGADRVWMRRVLVIAQIAVSLVLLVGALLFVRTLVNLWSIDPGFRQAGVLVASLDLRPTQTPASQLLDYQRRLLDRLAAVPGVSGAAAVDIVPVSDGGWNQRIVVDGAVQTTYANANRVSGGYFAMMGIPLRAGRTFDDRDTTSSPVVAVVNESFVATYLGGRPPIGRTFTIDDGPSRSGPPIEIVGVAADTKYNDLREPIGPIMYFASTQETEPGPRLTVLLATSGDADALRGPVSRAALEMGAGILLDFSTIERQRRDALLRERLMALLAGGFAGLALLLAAVGLYGVMAYTVARRRAEIGLRIALGATRGRVLTMIVRETGWLVGIGAAIGVVAAVFAARTASTLLFGLEPGDPVTVAGAAGLLAVVAALASAWPAIQATRMAPTAALRE